MIEKILIISFFTIGYCCTFWPGMIFEKIGSWLEVHLPEWINKPLWSCFICTCFWLGTGLYWFFLGNSWREWLLCVIPAMGINAAIGRLFELLELRQDNTQQEIKHEIKVTYE